MTLGWMICRAPSVVDDTANLDRPSFDGNFTSPVKIWAEWLGPMETAQDARASNRSFFSPVRKPGDVAASLGAGAERARLELFSHLHSGELGAAWAENGEAIPTSAWTRANGIVFAPDAGFVVEADIGERWAEIVIRSRDVKRAWKGRRGNSPEGSRALAKQKMGRECSCYLQAPPPAETLGACADLIINEFKSLAKDGALSKKHVMLMLSSEVKAIVRRINPNDAVKEQNAILQALYPDLATELDPSALSEKYPDISQWAKLCRPGRPVGKDKGGHRKLGLT